jgi:hypothetical protein
MDFNDLFLLECFYNQVDREFFDLYTIPSLNDYTISTRFQFLKKNEYLVEDPNDASKLIISVKGTLLINELYYPKVEAPIQVIEGEFTKRSPTEDELFEEWWKLYPSTTAWESDDGVKYVGSRSLKMRKPDAKKKYLKLLNQGLKADELLGSLKYEIKMKKLDSIKKGANQMDFFKGMESYLNQERYLTYMDLYKQNPDFVKDVNAVKSRRQNVRDI